MRDLILKRALEAVADDAGQRLRELLDAGEEIAYEVVEPGRDSPLCRYRPLSERFIVDRVATLRELESFASAREALEQAELAGPYLEELGVPVPPGPRERAERAILAFLCTVYTDSSDFALEEDAVAGALADFEVACEPREGEVEVVVPMVGLQLPTDRLELAGTTLVRADVVDVPEEARRGVRSGGAAWEPTYLAVARIALEDDATQEAIADPVADAFARLVTTLRLFKDGGIGLGPHAWVRGGSDRWRRVATGAGQPRPGGYRLAETELGNLVDLARSLASRPGRLSALRGAVTRFEAGLERRVPIDALNDHLLALRFLLEGRGPTGAGMAMRAAALVADPEGRGEVKATVDAALATERELWSGDPASREVRPAELAGEIENIVRAILRDAVTGAVGDPRGTADEILLADGLAAGEGDAAQRGETSEWTAVLRGVVETRDGGEDAAGEPAVPPLGAGDWRELATAEPVEARGEESIPSTGAAPPTSSEQPTEALPVTEPTLWGTPASDSPAAGPEVEPPAAEPEEPAVEQPAADQPAWLEEVGASETLDWPSRPGHLKAAERPGAERPAPERARKRVEYLFPRPETTEWEVDELRYERRQRALAT